MAAEWYIHAAYHNKHWWQAFWIYQHRWPWTLRKGFLVNFLHNFALRHTFQEWIAPKWLEIDQDNLRMKFSPWNVDFSSPSPDTLDSSRPAHVSVNERYPCKKWFILCACLARKWLQIGTTMLLIITSTDEELLMNVNIDNLEWPWTLKILI